MHHLSKQLLSMNSRKGTSAGPPSGKASGEIRNVSKGHLEEVQTLHPIWKENQALVKIHFYNQTSSKYLLKGEVPSWHYPEVKQPSQTQTWL